MNDEVANALAKAIMEQREEKDNETVEKLYDSIVNGNRVGQPTKFEMEHIKVLLNHMGVKGKSYYSLAFVLGIKSVKTLYNWEKLHPIWKEAKEVAESGRLNCIEDNLINLANGTFKGNAAAAIFYAKNAAPDHFKDKRDLEITGGITWVIDTGIPSLPAPNNNIQQAIEAECHEITNSEDSNYSDESTDFTQDSEDEEFDL